MENEKKLILHYAAQTVRYVINDMPDGTLFYGHELKKRCLRLKPELKNMYIETFLREMRKWCHNQYILVSRKDSLYQKIGEPVEAK